MVRIPGFHCRGPGSIPSWGTEIPQAMWQGQKKKKETHDPAEADKRVGVLQVDANLFGPGRAWKNNT